MSGKTINGCSANFIRDFGIEKEECSECRSASFIRAAL